MVESSLLSSFRDTVTCETGLKNAPSYDDVDRNLQQIISDSFQLILVLNS